jgi:hypothetical protein
MNTEESKLEAQQEQLHIPVVMGSIFLIEKGWIDPMENRNADGYEPFGFKLTEQEAKDFCELHGYWTDRDCWSIQFKPNKVMSKYRYEEIQYCP